MTAPLVRHEGKDPGSEGFWTFLALLLWLHLPCSTTAALWKRGIRVSRQAAIRTIPHSMILHIRTSIDVPKRYVSVIAPRNYPRLEVWFRERKGRRTRGIPRSVLLKENAHAYCACDYSPHFSLVSISCSR